MSTNSPKNVEEQEVDLALISQKVKGFFQSITDFAFNAIEFVLRNKIILGALFVLGVGIGIYLDKTNKTYDHEVVVKPNFGSADYLYSQIDLIESKIKENDTIFLQKIGIQDASKLSKIEIKPIIDIYQFINNSSERNFELLKLMVEDNDIKKIIEEKPTSKNYSYHLISFKTGKFTNSEKTIIPLMKFLNSSEFYSKIKKEAVSNMYLKMKANDLIISQIDGFLNGIASGNGTSEKLVYYNENSPLNELIETKERLVRDQGDLRVNLVATDKIIKDVSQVINIKNTEATNGKLKLILPFLFMGIFVVLNFLFTFYKKQSRKRKQTITN